MYDVHHTRFAAAALVVAVLAGFLLRGLFPGRIAVEHFDEGVYASNLVAGESYEFAYPSRHLFAPPLLPGIIEWSQVALGVGDIASVAVNLLAGGLTVWLVGFVAGRWFGTPAGLAAAALAALSGIHILYSRTALTDPLLCLWLAAAVFAIWCSLADGDKSWAVVAGLLTGLAWWTKYNGWLPLAIGVAGATAWLLTLRDRKRIVPTIVCLLIIVGTAVLAWVPVWYQLPGGYGPVAANHRQYVVGAAGWFDSLGRQLIHHRQLDGLSGSLSLGVATLAAAASLGYGRKPAVLALAAGLWGLATISCSSVVLAAIAVYWMWRNVRIRPADSEPSDGQAARQLAVWLLVAWIAGLTVATPLYTPYPRITLPWLVAIWLAGGAGIAMFAAAIGERTEESATTTRVAWAAVCCGVLLAVLPWFWGTRPAAVAWQDRRGMARLAAAIKDDVERRLDERGVSRGADFVLDVYGEPSLYFQLRSQGVDLALPVSSLRFAQPDAPVPEYPTFLIAGPHADATPQFADQFLTAQPRLTLVKEYEFLPSELVRRNEASTGDPYAEPEAASLRLYEVQ